MRADLPKMIASVLSLFLLLSTLSIGVASAQAFTDLNRDGKIDILDMVLSLNRNIVPGDTNNDGKVNIIDLATIGLAYGSHPGEPHWNPDADVANTVDEINIFDLATVGKNFNIQNTVPLALDPPVSIVPSAITVTQGDSFDINVTVDTPVDMYAFDVIIAFNNSVLSANSVTEGDFLNKDGLSTFPVNTIDNNAGTVWLANTRIGNNTEVSGAGTLATVTFNALGLGTSDLVLVEATLVNAIVQPIPGVTTHNGTVDVQIQCITHDHFACHDDDVYWQDSCSVVEDKAQECGDDYCNVWGNTYCKTGDVYQSRTCHDLGCSSAACIDIPIPEERQVEACPNGCSGGQCVIQCNQNSDCGVDGPFGGPICVNDDVVQEFRNHTCNNAGNSSSYCTYKDSQAKIQECGNDYCELWQPNYCDSGDLYRKRTCHTLGCGLGACSDLPLPQKELVQQCQFGCQNDTCVTPACSFDIDCGINGLVGGPYCYIGDSYQDFRTHTCNNPGTLAASCSYSDSPIQISDCGVDSCNPWGQAHCDNGDLKRKRDCYDRECSSGLCITGLNPEEQVVEACQYGCENDACVVPACIYDSDCGTDGMVGPSVCGIDDLYRDYRTHTCNNPGTSNSSCSYADVPAMETDCGDDYCELWQPNFCDNGDVSRTRTCHDLGCSVDACYDTPSTDKEVVQSCQYGCSNAQCLQGANIVLTKGTNLFSLPLVPPGGSVSFNGMSSSCTVTVNGAGSVCSGYNIAFFDPLMGASGGYQCLNLDDALYPGQGYFIKVADDCSATVAGKDFDIYDGILGYEGTGVVKSGWNNLGAPTLSVPFSTIISNTNCDFAGQVPRKYVYGVTTCAGVPDYPSGGYEQCEVISGVNRCFCEVSVLKPGFGYYVWAENDCAIG